MRRIAAVAAVTLVAIAARAAPTTPADPTATIPIQMTWDQKIPMRDGVKLSATIYRDPAQTKRVPVIVVLTPYIAAHAAKQGIYFAQHGYVFAAIDLRGRGNSDGTFVPGQVEAKDGFDAIEWLAKQPWCDGQVAMWGGSWLGFTQWSVAKEFPPHLKAIAPSSAVYPGVDYPQPSGIFMSYMLSWLNYVHGRALNQGVLESSLMANAEWQQITTGRSFAELEDLTGEKGTVFRTWLAHPREDGFWRAMTPRPDQYAKLTIPILTIVGHYDDDQKGALTYYDRHMANGAKDVIAKHMLVIGPWDHSGTRRPKAELGGVSFGSDAVLDMEALHKAWYDYVLKQGPRPEFLKDRVACFVMGRNAWIYASDLKHLEGAATKLELDASGAVAGDVTRSGRLQAAAGSAASIVIKSDPAFLPPRDEVGPDADYPAFLKDQRSTYRDSGQVVLNTAPFIAETVFAGRPRLHLQVAVDQPDADINVELDEVLPDGSAIFLTTSSIRLRYRKGGIDASPMTPGKSELVEIPPLGFFARAIAKGSRLRLVIDATPRIGWQRNSNTGGDLAIEKASAGRVAKVTITTGPGSGSVLELPRPDDTVLTAK